MATLIMRCPGGLPKALTLSYDDGQVYDKRLVEIMSKNGIKGIWNSIADTLNGEHDVGGSSFHINLPKFAQGGFVEDGLFLMNHHELVGQFSNGKTAVANNQQIIAGIEQGVYNAVSRANSQNNGSASYIANEIIVDGEVLARSVTKAQEKQNRRYSPSMA